MSVQGITSKIKTKIASFCSEFGSRGSFLLEIAVALSILGLLSGFFITKIITTNKVLRVQTTKNNIETVKAALAAYLANHNRLPRPSRDNSGRESAYVGGDLQNSVGFVPFNTLGISSKTALDGNAKRLIYIVEPALTAPFESIYEQSLLEPYFCVGIATPAIFIKGGMDLSPDVIAFVIDTKEPAVLDRITVSISHDTVWISRDMLLVQYLKNCPCKREARRSSSVPPADDFAF